MRPTKGHILICGYTPSTAAALEELAEEIEASGAVILTKKPVPQMHNVTHLSVDYLVVKDLRDRRVGLQTCSVCVVFAESGGDGVHPRTADMHTVLAVYNIKKERADVPVIAEVVDRENTSFIESLGCADVIYKETIDANLITSCILHPNISPLFYDLLTVRGKVLRSTTTAELGLPSDGTTYRDVRMDGLYRDVTYLGFLDPNGAVRLMPPNSTAVCPACRLVYIE